jgi:hypothetical protein
MSKITDEQLHLNFIEKLIDAELLFIEDNLVYIIKNSVYDSAVYFLRTNTLSIKENSKTSNSKLSMTEAIKVLRGSNEIN